MAEDHASEADDEMLRDFLRGQRESVLAIVEGLGEDAWHRSIVPTGWTPAGMLEHLGGAEWHAGHLDIARELLDGKTRLGGR